MTPAETTDITLFVRTSDEDVARWNRQRIVDALIRETDIDDATAQAVSIEVEKQIVASGIALLTTSLIREMVDAKLIERGLEQPRRMHARLGFPLYDVRELILHQNKENANVPHGPEGTSLLLAEGIKREYAFYDVFSQPVVDAHVSGAIHLHGLGYIDRPYSFFHSLEYLKKFGLNLPNSLTVAKPARHAEVLLAHMVRFGAALQGHFTGAIAWDAVNFSFAPYLVKMSREAVKQFAQMLIYEFSQLTAARGGQAIFTDIHLYWDAPAHYKDVPAVGPGGIDTGKKYSDYTSEARQLAWALFEVFREGDGAGKPFTFPRPMMHLSHAFFDTPDHEAFLEYICDVAVEKGNPCFVFDREDLPGIVKDALSGVAGRHTIQEYVSKSWQMRAAAVQNITLNLPRLGYQSGGDKDRLFSLIDQTLELMAAAHGQKRDFIEKLMSYGPMGPLAMLTMNLDGRPYLDMDRAVYLMGILGMNELVHICTGRQLHESDEAAAFGLAVMKRIKTGIDKLAKKHRMTFLPEQTPAETTAYRFARLDLKHHSPAAGRFVRGSIVKGEIYYTNSTQANCAAPIPALEKVKLEGRFHPFFNAGAVTHLWLGEAGPAKQDLVHLIKQAFRETSSKQIMFSPEFTACGACGSLSKGLKDYCVKCGEKEVDGIARISQYFSKTASWNKGKLGELKDRKRIGSV
ncbi:MAG: anaerobic ribonucleoside-triphosphate reductase [Deltaproteobacteria bacterium]|nr:anaerobic ribonucleoside-triphosphate reductase [Deltaproteobacteria bacterium]